MLARDRIGGTTRDSQIGIACASKCEDVGSLIFNFHHLCRPKAGRVRPKAGTFGGHRLPPSVRRTELCVDRCFVRSTRFRKRKLRQSISQLDRAVRTRGPASFRVKKEGGNWGPAFFTVFENSIVPERSESFGATKRHRQQAVAKKSKRRIKRAKRNSEQRIRKNADSRAGQRPAARPFRSARAWASNSVKWRAPADAALAAKPVGPQGPNITLNSNGHLGQNMNNAGQRMI